MFGWHMKENHDGFAGIAVASGGTVRRAFGKGAGAWKMEEGKWNGPMK